MKNYLGIFLTGCCILVSCAKQAPQTDPALREIHFTASLGTFEVRATDTSFEQGDVIGLQAGAPLNIQNARLTLGSSGLTPETPIYWGMDQPQNQDTQFYAYYPYQAGEDISQGFHFQIQADQSTHAKYTASDFMMADRSAAPVDKEVHLQFTHHLSKVVLTIDNRKGIDIADVFLGDVYGRALVQAGKTPINMGQPGTVKAGKVAISGDSVAWALIVVPQTTAPKLIITSKTGEQYTYEVPEAIRFASGKRYKAQVTIDAKTLLTDFTTEVSDWVDDGDIQFGQDNPGAVTARKYLTFRSEGTTKVGLSNHGNTPILYYSFDTVNWTQWDYSKLTFSKGSPLYICGSNPEGLSTKSEYSIFSPSGDKFSVSGDVMSLVDKDEDVLEIPCSYCFNSLFFDCRTMTAAPALPATKLADGCYYQMFERCSTLSDAPALPATTMKTACYSDMFASCTSLVAAPNLPATTLAEECYCYMFSGCSNLTTPPALPAKSLASRCYLNMFSYCSSLVTAPDLPAPKLEFQCYTGMFVFCEKLSYVKCLATDISANSCVSSWLNRVADTGTFVKAAGMDVWKTGSDGIPQGWTVKVVGE